MCYYYFASSFSLRLSVFHNRLEKKVWGIGRVIKHLSGNQDLTETELLVTSVFSIQQNWHHWQISNHCAKNSYNLFLMFSSFYINIVSNIQFFVLSELFFSFDRCFILFLGSVCFCIHACTHFCIHSCIHFCTHSCIHFCMLPLWLIVIALCKEPICSMYITGNRREKYWLSLKSTLSLTFTANLYK